MKSPEKDKKDNKKAGKVSGKSQDIKPKAGEEVGANDSDDESQQARPKQPVKNNGLLRKGDKIRRPSAVRKETYLQNQGKYAKNDEDGSGQDVAYHSSDDPG